MILTIKKWESMQEKNEKRKLKKEAAKKSIIRSQIMAIVTCVYCGHEYPNGTPASKHLSLTEHIKICEKHPMRVLEEQNKVLKKALQDFVGVESEEELDQMELLLRSVPAPEADKITALNAIHALRSCK